MSGQDPVHVHIHSAHPRGGRDLADERRHHAHGGGAHSHGVSPGADARYLTVALCLLGAFIVVEVVVAVVSGSLALLSDAGHMLTDVAALAASLWALRLAGRPAAGVWTFGFQRAEILSAAGNGITLLVVSALVTLESIRRLLHPPSVDGLLVLVVALVGIGVNVLAAGILAKANRSSLNIEGAFQHILTDLY